MISWEEFITEAVTTFRKEFQKFSHKKQLKIKKELFDELPLKPCQIEVLDLGVGKAVIWILRHDNRFPDMTLRIHKNSESLESSELAEDTDLAQFVLHDKNYEEFLSRESLHIFTKRAIKLLMGSQSSQQLAEYFLSSAKRVLRTEQVDTIERSTDGLKKSIAKIPEEDVRNELLTTTKKIDGALREIRRIDEEIGKVRQMVGVSQEYQDWKILVSDVDRLKGEHVPREVFESKMGELSTKIEALEKIEKAYERLASQQAKVLEQQSSFLKWIKYSTILVPIAVALIPVIEILIRHFLGVL